MDLPFSVPSAPVLFLLWALAMTASFAVLGRRARLTAGRALTATALATYLSAVAALTLFPHTGHPGAYADWSSVINVVPFSDLDRVTFVLNVVMTVPLGLLAPLVLRIRSLPAIAALGLVFSLGIELTQGVTDLLFDSDRVVDINDLIANTAGAVVGWLVFSRVRRHRLTRQLHVPAAPIGTFRR